MDICLAAARAAASRKNGAKSCGPKTPEGKARSAQNALKHGLRAQKHVVLPGENAAAFEALEAALLEELAPEGALQTVLARRIVAAAWRLERAERLETELFAENQLAGRSLGHALIRDGNGARAFDTLLRYRGGTLAELWRALRTLKALQAEQAATTSAAVLTPQRNIAPNGEGACSMELAPHQEAGGEQHANPIEPECRGNPGEFEPVLAVDEPAQHPKGPTYVAPRKVEALSAVALARSQRGPQPNEPSLGLAQAETAAGRGVRGRAPGAIAPPRERRHPAALPAQPARSTP
ncbi:MAG: hypothetical protein ACREGK_14900 [Geminicoccales bacterium]